MPFLRHDHVKQVHSEGRSGVARKATPFPCSRCNTNEPWLPPWCTNDASAAAPRPASSIHVTHTSSSDCSRVHGMLDFGLRSALQSLMDGAVKSSRPWAVSEGARRGLSCVNATVHWYPPSLSARLRVTSTSPRPHIRERTAAKSSSAVRTAVAEASDLSATVRSCVSP